jgi:acyl-CoA synthetase (NDP forming)
MQTHIDFRRIDALFHSVAEEGRDQLFEYETYELLRLSGAESVPRALLLSKGSRPSNEELAALPGDRAVLKIVSPCIVHKTDVGGVRIVEKQPGKIRSAWRRMLDEVPENYAAFLDQRPELTPERYAGLAARELRRAISADTRGVLLVEFMPPDSLAFGNELLVSLRRTREFGTVLTAGLGGTDTEIYAARFRPGQAVVSASTRMTTPEQFFRLFRSTIAYEKLAGRSRGQVRIVSDDQLVECFASFIEMADRYSPDNPDAPAIIEELEVNPFAFTDYQMVPLDGLCRVSRPQALPAPRPVHNIRNLLQPARIGIAGVSASRPNFGRIILKNILAAGFDPDNVAVLRPGACSEERVDGAPCVPDLESMGRVDLFVVAVGAEQVPALAEEIMDKDLAASVLLIPGGLGETAESAERGRALRERIDRAHADGGGPVFLGGNSLGVLSRPGRYDTIFIPGEKLEKPAGPGGRTAFVSQSGAFLVTRASKLALLDPAYLVSIGNQSDLTAGDFLRYFQDADDIDVIALYMEGFKDLDGLALCRAVRAAVRAGKEVVFYKAGRTPEGMHATAGHTASVAGDYMVCASCVRQAGAMVADTLTQFEDLAQLAALLHDKDVPGNRLAAMSGAGFEAVAMADSIQGDGFAMRMAEFSEQTRAEAARLLAAQRLDRLVEVRNPLDINPAADDRLHADMARLLAADAHVDGVVVGLDPLSPAMKTLPEGLREGESLDDPQGIAALFPAVVAETRKPMVGVVDGGPLFDPLAKRLLDRGVPVFRSCDRAVAALAKYMEGRLHAQRLRDAD